jgi:malate dehydrogenase
MSNIQKIAIIGAGSVGATLAQRVLESGASDVVLLDIMKDMALAKSLDLLDAAPIIGHERAIKGSGDYKDISSSDIVVVTAGFVRRPGMTREDLVAKNAAIVGEVSSNIKRYAPSSIVIVVTNPLDAMTYLAYKATGFDRKKVFGMAGVLDAGRFSGLIAGELKVPRSSVETYILGSHGDTMVPVLSQTRVGGQPITELLPREKIEEMIKKARNRGAEIVKLLGSGSAYYSPSAAVFKMITAIAGDTRQTLVASSFLSGEYGLNDICIGVPCRIGKGGIEEIVKIGLSKEEESALRRSAESIKSTIALLPSVK